MRIIAPLLALMLLSSTANATSFVLSETCPPTFEKLADGHCQLRTLYDFYDSPPQHGGVQAQLPPLQQRYTPQQIDLGRYLFFDPLLSKQQDMSCASCHQLDKGLSDGRKRSLGAIWHNERKELTRSTPSLWNVAFLRQLMWDGRSDSLKQQAALPLLSDDEMGNSEASVVRSVSSSALYQRLFAIAYDAPPSFDNITDALAAFQSSLVSLNSRYDRYAHGDLQALNEQEIRGHNAFRGFVARCSQCHVPPLFTDSELAVVGAPANDNNYVDSGAGALSKDPDLEGAFRVPTLRNITRTAPYFHSGQFDNLTDVVRFYNNTRGHAAPAQQPLNLHWHIHMTDGPKLSESNVEDIVAFLQSLEDEKNLPQPPSVLPSGLTPVPTLQQSVLSLRNKDNNK